MESCPGHRDRWDVDGWALVVARRSLPGLDIAVSQTGFPTHGRPQGPHPYPTPLPPLRETHRLTIFSFLLLLRLMRITADVSARGNPTTYPDYFVHPHYRAHRL